MRAYKVITDPKAFQLIGDETRRRMIYLLRAKEYTVSQLAAELQKTPQAIYHHIAKLRDAGLVEVAREERVDHFIETYYQAAAEVFEFHHGSDAVGAEYAKKAAMEAMRNLARLGIETDLDEATVEKLVDLKMRIDTCGKRPDLDEKVLALDDVGFLTRQDLGHYARILLMSDRELDDCLRLTREFYETLRSKTRA